MAYKSSQVSVALREISFQGDNFGQKAKALEMSPAVKVETLDNSLSYAPQPKIPEEVLVHKGIVSNSTTP